MAARSNLVNLDAMIERSDFASEGKEKWQAEYPQVESISVRDFTKGALIGPTLRKPDFQRETNHWSSEQVASLLECFVKGELIPSVILWRSPMYLFVIDGGHRLSALKAWILDDYGDGARSQAFFGYKISDEQKAAAAKCRNMVKARVGEFHQLEKQIEQPDLPPEDRRRISAVISRVLQIQWVTGNAEKAEGSFFRINTKGTPLDQIEETLLKNRRRPIAIGARAVIRAGSGHRYWSLFEPGVAREVEEKATLLHDTLFEPELKHPIKTLDLPLGGSKGMRAALEVLLEFMLIACRDQLGVPEKIADQAEDPDGAATVRCLERALKLASRVTGNDGGSLGLHPAVYFYGPTVRHSGPLFMGTIALIGRKMANNDAGFFPRWTRVRQRLESALLEHKELIATILQKTASRGRSGRYEKLLGEMIDKIDGGHAIEEEDIVAIAGLSGKVVTGSDGEPGVRFSDDAKTDAFARAALGAALRCPICGGYLDPEKSLSYDHVKRVRDGGRGSGDNCQLTHPFCNQSVKS